MKQLVFTRTSLMKISLCISFLLSSPSYGMHRLRFVPTHAKKAIVAGALATSVSSRTTCAQPSSTYDPSPGQNACAIVDFLYGRVIGSTHPLKALVRDSVRQCSTRITLVDALENDQTHGQTVVIDGDSNEQFLNRQALETQLSRLDSDLITYAQQLAEDFDAVIEARERRDALTPSTR